VPLLTFIFPYAVLSIIRFPDVDALFYTSAIVQFPAYSVVWYFACKRTRLRGPGWVLVGLHLVVAVAAFVIVASSVH
jgi:RsiW-degrading membrane proteinase PrsW (M82 family)